MLAKRFATRAVKKAFNAVGLDVTRREPLPVDTPHKFAPEEHAKYNWIKRADIRTVFDIGANVGQFAIEIHGIVPSATIYSFEPLTDCFDQLNFRASEIPSFRAFRCALGDENTRMPINRGTFTPSSSILPLTPIGTTNFPFTADTRQVDIEIRRLDDVVADLSLADNLLVKIDVQGFEDRVIRGGRETIRRASILIVETSFEPIYAGQPLFDDIYKAALDLGFSYHGAFGQLQSPIDGRVLQADSVFMR